MLQLGVRDIGPLTPTVPDELGNAKKEQTWSPKMLMCLKMVHTVYPKWDFLGSIMNDSGFQDIQKSKTNPCNIDRPLGTRFRRQTHENAQNLQETPRSLEKNVPCQSSFYSPENINNCLINTVTAWRISSCRYLQVFFLCKKVVIHCRVR